MAHGVGPNEISGCPRLCRYNKSMEHLETLIGAQLAVGIPGTEATAEVIEALRRTHAQSLVVFSRNFTSPEQFVGLLHTLNAALQRPLLVMVDHEGGRVVRFAGAEGITQFPDALTMARTQRPEQVERQGHVEAEELQQLGVHANLAPCVDVITGGADPIIGDRSYGSDPALVAAFAVSRIRGLHAGGVAACAKHFPGLGAVPRDPHHTLPTIRLDWQTLERVHLVPFRAAIDAGVGMVMSSHVCYPDLGDPEGLPATFSPNLIRRLLRETMGFSGLILSDDLEMGALRSLGGIGDAAVRTAAAGHDLLLICSDVRAALDAAQALRQAYAGGGLDQAELRASVTRMRLVRQKFLPASS